jgi:molybdate transport system substrate-binding protein
MVALAALSCRVREPEPIVVFAAASLEGAMLEVAAAYTARFVIGVALNTSGSNVLAQQIEAGAPADVFVSADARWIDDLIQRGALEAATRRELLTNRLVVIAHEDADFDLRRLSSLGELPFRYLSLADPDSVPAGRYARSLLEGTPATTGTVWDEVASRVAPAPDVRAAMAMVAAEPEAVGIVYRSDLKSGDGADGAGSPGHVVTLLEIDREPDPPIRYVGALVSRPGSFKRRAAAELLDFMAGAEARAIFERHGFIPLPQEP